jgi:single-strand DNA-binding protein
MNTMRNKVQLIGHLGMNPEIRIMEKGGKMAKIRMATSDVYTNNKGERVTDTEWHNVVAWGKTAEIAEKLLQKGSEVMIDGRLCHREYTGSNGVKRYSTEIVANSLLILERKQQ